MPVIITTHNTSFWNITTQISILDVVSTTEIYTKPFSDYDVILIATLLIVFMIFGIVANVVTIAVILTSQKLRSIFYYFILSLCVSDTISALISWINLYRRTWGFDNFEMPDFICVIYWGADLWTSYVTALHILSYAILRLISIKWPNIMKKMKRTHGKIWIVLIWLVGLICGGVPMGLFSGARPKDRTESAPDSKWPVCTQLREWLSDYRVYTLVAYAIFFYLPIICTVAVSLLLGVVMVKKRQNVRSHMSSEAAKARRAKEIQAITQLALIVGSFLLGYLPFTAFEFYTFQQKNTTASGRWIDWHFGTAQYICLRFSECLNPIFYNLASSKMRKETKLFCTRICRCRRNEDRNSGSIPEIQNAIGSGQLASTINTVA